MDQNAHPREVLANLLFVFSIVESYLNAAGALASSSEVVHVQLTGDDMPNLGHLFKFDFIAAGLQARENEVYDFTLVLLLVVVSIGISASKAKVRA